MHPSGYTTAVFDVRLLMKAQMTACNVGRVPGSNVCSLLFLEGQSPTV